MPLFATYPLDANSDFVPVLDLGSASRRYLSYTADQLNVLARTATPIKAAFGEDPLDRTGISSSDDPRSWNQQHVSDADSIYQWVVGGDRAVSERLNDELRATVATALYAGADCSAAAAEFRRRSINALMRTVLARLSTAEGAALIDRVATAECTDSSENAAQWQRFLHALARRDGAATAASAASLRKALAKTDPDRSFLIEAELFGNLIEGEKAANLAVWSEFSPEEREILVEELPIRLLLAHSGWRNSGAD
jgi:hypothetical protein